MLEVNPHIGKTRQELSKRMKTFDEAFMGSVQSLSASCANLPEFEQFNEVVRREHLKLNESLQALQCLYFEKPVEVEEEAQSKLELEFAQYSAMSRQSDIKNKSIELRIKRIQNINKAFKKLIMEPINQQIEAGAKINHQVLMHLVYVQMGLNNLSSIAYNLINNGLSWVVTKTKVQNKGIFARLYEQAVNSAISFIDLPKIALSCIFDIDSYVIVLNHLNARTTQYNEVAQPFQYNPIKRTNSFSGSPVFNLEEIKEQFSGGSMSLEKIVSSFSGMDTDILSVDDTANEVSERAILLAKEYFLTQLLVQLKDFQSVVDGHMICGVETDDKMTNLIDLCLSQEDLSPEMISFLMNKITPWLEIMIALGSKPFHHEYALDMSVLAQHYNELITQYQLLNFQLPILESLPKIKAKMSNAILFKISSQLNETATLKDQFKTLDTFEYPRKDVPEFQGLELIPDLKATTGAQQKAQGSGFYTDQQNQYFLKQVNNASFVADDIAEYMISNIAQFLGCSHFAQCKLVRSQNTDEVFVASRCSEGFKPLFIMDNRWTTRLAPHEAKGLLKTLQPEQIEQLTTINLMSMIVCDFDPNPANVGKTKDEGLIKIDHGWGLDGLCNDSLTLWSDNLFPFRHVGRLAPTNSINDYSTLFQKQFDITFLRAATQRMQDIEGIVNNIRNSLFEVCQIYTKATAPNALKDTYDRKMILKSLAARMNYMDDLDIESIAVKMGEAIYNKAHNLYLISLLINFNHSKSFKERKALFQEILQYSSYLNSNYKIRYLRPNLTIKHLDDVLQSKLVTDKDRDALLILRGCVELFISRPTDAHVRDGASNGSHRSDFPFAANEVSQEFSSQIGPRGAFNMHRSPESRDSRAGRKREATGSLETTNPPGKNHRKK